MLRIIGIVIAVTLLALPIQYFAYSEMEEGQVRVVDHNMYVDASGLVRVIGLVENNTDEPIGFVRVTAYLFDKDGNTLPKYSTLTLIRTIMPDSVGPFDIAVSDPMVGKKVVSYKFSLEWKVVNGKPDLLAFSNVKTYAVTHMDPSTFKYVNPHEHSDKHKKHNEDTDKHEPHAHSETSGTVSNYGDAHTKWVKVVAVWYDKDGNLSRVDWQVAKTRLAPGEEGVFVIMTHVASRYYSLIAESDDYVSVLIDDNERVMPVYEAPKAALFAMDGLDMSKISFADGSSNPVSLLKTGHQVQMMSTIKSNLNLPQKFVCIFQIVDSDGITVMLSWIASEISAGGTADLSVSWIPESEGMYNIKTFLWQGLTQPIPLSSEADSLLVTVSADLG